MGLTDRLRRLRDRLIADRRTRRLVAAFPLTRPIARRKARQLFDLMAGFVYSQVLLTAVRLDVFDKVAADPKTVPELAPLLGLGEEATHRLVDAAVSLGLLDRRSAGRIGLGELGAALVADPGLNMMIRHHALLYADLEDPVPLLKGEVAETRISRYWAYARADDPAQLAAADVGSYSTLMSLTQTLIAGEVLDAYPVGRHRHLLEVGGGEGTFAIEALRRAPHLSVTLFDLPPVAARATLAFDKAGFAPRARAVGGSFFDDPLPEGADVASLIRVAYDHGDESVRRILAAIYKALPPGGTLLLAEPMSGTPGAEPIGDAYFGFYLLAMRSGRSRTPEVLRSMLAEAGFTTSRLVPTRLPLQTRLIVATR